MSQETCPGASTGSPRVARVVPLRRRGIGFPSRWLWTAEEVWRMRELRKPASAGLAGLVLFVSVACGGGTTNQPVAVSTPTCVNASAPHKVHVVVQHQSGATTDRCVGFATDKEAGGAPTGGGGGGAHSRHIC